MAWNSAAMPIQGFTVFQTAPGAVLSFVPAMGTAELDQLIDAYVVQAATLQEKRAIVSMEFFTHNALTNQTHLFFPVNNPFNYVAGVTGSPASSLVDSGYGSSFNVSPVAQEIMTPASSAPATPVTVLQPAATAQRKNRVAKPKAKATKKSASAASRAFAHDFTGMPGMQILTKDGVDVTNSARGGKTKEDREHAHLIRLLKSCPTCKKKKIRCDPSHKRDLPSKSAAPEVQPAVKSRAVAAPSPASSQASNDAAQATNALKIAQPAGDFMDSLDFNFGLDVTDIDNFLSFGAEATDNMDFSFLMDEQALFTPATPNTVSPVLRNYASFSPTQSFMTSNVANVGGEQAAQLPYLQSDGHVDNYVDFTLFSPASSPLGEEPQEMRSAHPSPVEEELRNSESPRQRGSGMTERTRSGSGVVSRARSPLSPVLPQIGIPFVNFFTVGPETGHDLVDSVANTVRVNTADGGTRHGGTDHGGSGLGGTGHGGPGHGGSGYGGGEFAGGAGVIPQGLGLPLDRIKPQQSGASTDVVRSAVTVAGETQQQSAQSAHPHRIAYASTDGVRSTTTINPADQLQWRLSAQPQRATGTSTGGVLSKDVIAGEDHSSSARSTHLQRVALASADGDRSRDVGKEQSQSTLSTQPQRVAGTSAVLQLQQQQQQQQTTPHDQQSWYSSSGSSLDIRPATSSTNAPIVQVKSESPVRRVPMTSTMQQIPRTSDVAVPRDTAAEIRVTGQSGTHSAPLSSRNITIIDTEPQDRVEISIRAPVTDAQVVYSSSVAGAERHRRREDSVQQTGAAGGSVQQRASTAETLTTLAHAGLAGVTQSQVPRSTPCPPPHGLWISQNAALGSSDQDEIEGPVVARTQTSSATKPVAKRTDIDSFAAARKQTSSVVTPAVKMTKTTTTSSTTNVTMTLGKLRTAAVSLQDALFNLLLAVGTVLMFAAVIQHLHDAPLSMSKLALSISPLVLRHMVPALPSQASPSSLFSSIRKEASTLVQRPAALCVLG
ncbi:hypothetical protein MCOR25_002561 [Pyricularia grisea]|nr:hypothetical protein MCOR25_002561 [Pyricularia grisea]